MRYVLVILLILSMMKINAHRKASDSYIRDRVVKLISPAGQCTGVEVKGDSGTVYILTAGHCRPLLDKQGYVVAESETGQREVVQFVAEDPYSDLMLLQGMDGKSIDIAKKTSAHEPVHSMTHGNGFPTFRTDGELLIDMNIPVPISEITTHEELEQCVSMPKQTALPTMDGSLICVLLEDVEASTAWIVPGSSGGPVVNDAGQLVGIVSATDGKFSYLVQLSDIKAFLKDK